MKIGILTFHCAHNYGAMLQCYALQEYLRSLGHEVYVVDYRPTYLTNGYLRHSLRHWLARSPWRTVKKLLTEPFLYRKREVRWDGFHAFMTEYLNLYPYDPASTYADFDWMLFGSDQIWNRNLTGGELDEVFLGKGIECKKATYAASMGVINLDQPTVDLLTRYLPRFEALSVREISLRDALQPLVNKKIEAVCDPVLLLSRSHWERLCRPVSHARPYVLCYNLLQSETCREQAEIVAKARGLDIVEISGKVLPFISEKQCKQQLNPIEFISYFKEASFVVTSSFHGTAFSLIFQKEFYVIGMGHLADRSASLLHLIGLSERLLQNVLYIADEEYNYTSHNGQIKDWISKSIMFLNFLNEG